MTKRITLPLMYRNGTIEAGDAPAEGVQDDRTVHVTASTESIGMQRYGDIVVEEVLDHSPNSVRMARAGRGLPVLQEHDRNRLVGVSTDVQLTRSQMFADLRLSESAEGQRELADIRSGIRRNVSIGYRVYSVEKQATDKGAIRYRAVDWEPYEISLVSVPEDHNAVIHRGSGAEFEATVLGDDEMPENAPVESGHERTVQPVQTIDINAEKERVRAAELERVRTIRSLGSIHDAAELAEQHVTQGLTVDAFRAVLLERMADDPNEPTVQRAPINPPVLNLSRHEQGRYSIQRAIRALAFPEEQRYRQEAGFEFECSRALSQQLHQDARGILVPMDVFTRQSGATRPGEGGELVATETTGLIELLRNRMITTQLGATVLNGLVGNLSIPRHAGASTAYWVAEGVATTQSNIATDQVPMSPNNLTGELHYSKQLITQSSYSVEQMHENDLVRVLGLEFDRAAFYGSGAAGQPQGIVGSAGVTQLTDYTAPGPTWPEVVSLETAIAANNADLGNLAYACAANGRGYLKSTVKYTNGDTPMWDSTNILNGYRVGVSNQITATEYWFANWADLVLGQWGALDLTTDPYTRASFAEIRIIALLQVDVALRHGESFAYIDQV